MAGARLTMSTLTISFTIGSLLVLVMLPLSILVSARRAALGKQLGNLSAVAFGDADDLHLRRRIRAFGNFIEYAPLGLLMVMLLEFHGASETLVWAVGLLLFGGRVVHAAGMLSSENPLPRALGMFATYVALAVPVVWCLSKVLT